MTSTKRGKAAAGPMWLLPLLPLLFVFAGCSDETLNLFFDIPPPSQEELAAEAAKELERAAAEAKAAQKVAPAGAGQLAPEEEGEPPAIEAVKSWPQAEEMLPKDDMEQTDWVAALEQGVIKPRQAIDGPRRGQTAFFKFDFFLPGPDPSYDAFFPHSVHTEWLDCKSCHPKIFPKRGTQITMDEVFGGEYCGKCHGVVAFGLDACARCHTAME